jgi:hypothetical protein
MMRQAPQYFTQ